MYAFCYFYLGAKVLTACYSYFKHILQSRYKIKVVENPKPQKKTNFLSVSKEMVNFAQNNPNKNKRVISIYETEQ